MNWNLFFKLSFGVLGFFSLVVVLGHSLTGHFATHDLTNLLMDVFAYKYYALRFELDEEAEEDE